MTVNIIGATVWSIDRVYLGQITQIVGGGVGKVDARVTLNPQVFSKRRAVLRVDPAHIRNGKITLGISYQNFARQVQR